MKHVMQCMDFYESELIIFVNKYITGHLCSALITNMLFLIEQMHCLLSFADSKIAKLVDLAAVQLSYERQVYIY